MFVTVFSDVKGIQSVQVQGKTVYFDFSYRFGPLVTDKEGTPLKKQPIAESHPFWRPFNVWLEEHKKTNPERISKPLPDPSAYLDRRS